MDGDRTRFSEEPLNNERDQPRVARLERLLQEVASVEVEATASRTDYR